MTTCLFIFASSIETAVSNFEAWEAILKDMYNMYIKHDSRFVVPSRTKTLGNKTFVSETGRAWEVVDSVTCLGNIVSGSGSEVGNFHRIMNAISRTFWANHKALVNRQAPVSSRLKFWRCLVFSVCDYYFAGLRPVVSVAEKFEAHINKLARFVVGVRPLLEDTKAQFSIRRNSEIARYKSLAGFDFRGRWGYKLATWVEHIHRHPESPAFALLESQDDSWLRQRRIDVGKFGGSRSIHSGDQDQRVRACTALGFSLEQTGPIAF